jgi:hypothetical protein
LVGLILVWCRTLRLRAPMRLQHAPFVLFAVAAAVVFASCGNDRSGDEPKSSETAVARETPSPVPECPNDEGGACLGLLQAGSYQTTVFGPAITYRVAEGWANYEDTPGNFLLVPPGDDLEGVNAGTSDYIGVYTAVAPTRSSCSERPAPGVQPAPAAIAESIRRRPDLSASQPRDIDVGGLKGVVMDVELAKDWTKPCPFSDGAPFGLLIVGVPPSALGHGVFPGMTIRLYLLDTGSQTLAVEVDDLSAGKHLAKYTPVVEGLRFAN